MKKCGQIRIGREKQVEKDLTRDRQVKRGGIKKRNAERAGREAGREIGRVEDRVAGKWGAFADICSYEKQV